MPKVSAGLLLYRKRGKDVEVLLIHPGGPIWAKRDLGAWSIPKGEAELEEELLEAAKREFGEETGFPSGESFLPLGSVIQKSGKVVHAWAFEGDCDPGSMKSVSFKMEWPPHSGRETEFPEADKAGFFTIEEAKKKINPAQAELLERLRNLLCPV